MIREIKNGGVRVHLLPRGREAESSIDGDDDCPDSGEAEARRGASRSRTECAFGTPTANVLSQTLSPRR